MSEGDEDETVVDVTTILGYARVSTAGQDLDTPLAAEGVESGHVFTDKLSGAVNTARPGLAALLHYAREGDAVVVTAIDRLGRSVAEVTRTIAELGERRILLRALREGIDTSTPTGRAVAAIMATLAELELELGADYTETDHGHEWSAMTGRNAARNLIAVAKALAANPLPVPESDDSED